MPVSIADCEQLVVFGGGGVALPFELKLDGFREVFYREQLRGFGPLHRKFFACERMAGFLFNICIDIGLRAFDFCGDIERKAAKCAQKGVAFFEGERGESRFGIERVQLVSHRARFFGRIETHQGEDVDPNALLEADVGRKDALLDFERRIVDFHKGAMILFAAVKPRCCGAIRRG